MMLPAVLFPVMRMGSVPLAFCVQVRWHVLKGDKLLLSPQPRLRTGFFSSLSRSSFPADAIMEACSSGKCLSRLWGRLYIVPPA